jgi:arylsulfatase A-like enzyme
LLVHYKAPHRPWDPVPRHANLFKDVKIPEPPTLLDDYKNRSKAAANATLKIGENNTERDLGEKPPAGLQGNDLRQWAYQRFIKRYLACVAAVDDNVGRILDYLDKNGLTEDTLVVYTSDQGFFLGEHGFYDKRFIYEPSILTPLIIRWPGHIQPGSVSNDLVLNVDHAPTLLECAGLKATNAMQGHSYKSILEGKTLKDWQTTMYYRYWMHGADHNVPAHYGVRAPRYTLIYYYGDPLNMRGAAKFKATPPEWELFDRQKDPEQMVNVYNDPAYQTVVQELTKELQRLRKELGDER